MNGRTAENRQYGMVAKSLHWLIFVLVTADYAAGLAMPHVNPRTQNEGIVAWHVTIGTAILFFMIVRLIWRLAKPVPLIASGPAWQPRLAHVTHMAIYLLIFVIIALGLSAASFQGWTVQLFGTITLPSVAARGTQWAHDAGDVHDFLAYVLLGFIALHIAGALYHHFVMRDRIFQRMLFGA